MIFSYLPRDAILAISLLLSFLTSSVCAAEVHDVLCTAGEGSFEAEFTTGVRVSVGAARRENFAVRACAATLSWDKQQLSIADEVAQLDVDAFGADLGFGVPVVAFQVKKSDADCCMVYQIFALQKPSRLLQTIAGGDFFGAADTDLDGRVEIWTDDAAAVNGFEKLTLGEMDILPTVVLRFEHGRLLDASAEFQPYFDSQIAKVRASLGSDDLRDFKNSDGRLSSSPFSAEQLHRLRGVKAKVLEIVWSYLYSGREGAAWHSIDEMWPAGDVARIRKEIVIARSRGIRAQLDSGETESPKRRRNRVPIFDAVDGVQSERTPAVIPPHMIFLRRPPSSTDHQAKPEESVL